MTEKRKNRNDAIVVGIAILAIIVAMMMAI